MSVDAHYLRRNLLPHQYKLKFSCIHPRFFFFYLTTVVHLQFLYCRVLVEESGAESHAALLFEMSP